MDKDEELREAIARVRHVVACNDTVFDVREMVLLADAAESTLTAKPDDPVLRAAIERVEEFSKGGFVSSMYLSGLTGELHTVLEAARSTLGPEPPKTKTVWDIVSIDESWGSGGLTREGLNAGIAAAIERGESFKVSSREVSA